MENKIINSRRDDLVKEDSFCRSSNEVTLYQRHGFGLSEFKFHTILRMINHKQRAKQLHHGDGVRKTLVRKSNISRSSIPKHITCLDENYLRHCLDLIHISASKSTLSLKLHSSHLGYPAFMITKMREDREQSVGTITNSQSMINILSSPLLRLEKNLINFKESDSSSGALSVFSSPKREKAMRNQLSYDRSSRNSSCSDQSSSSSSTHDTFSCGMLQFSWNPDGPHFIFSVDGQNDVYEAERCKITPRFDKSADYVYSFRRRRKEHVLHDRYSGLVGKMTVSSSYKLCADYSKISETEFVLLASAENNAISSSHNRIKTEGLAKKIAKAFRTTNMSRHFGETDAILEWEPLEDTDSSNGQIGSGFLDADVPTNLELAAIIVKNPVCDNRTVGLGGWGLNFLKRSVHKYSDSARNTDECSTSISVIVPAGFHGGPNKRNGGPSSLIQRWRCGGGCDCGGWDIGCPLTVLNTASEGNAVFVHADPQHECKSYDLFIEGSERTVPTMRIVNVHDDLYLVHFQPTLSPLQSFSVAVAIIVGRIHPCDRERRHIEMGLKASS